MGALLDYSHYTNDSTYDEVLTAALSAQAVGPSFDLMVPTYFGSEGNDDQAFWTFSVLSAAERNFPQTSDTSVPSYLQIAENAWNSLAARWNLSACGGGLLWQIFADNPNGLDYRNSVSNGGLFQISARLYRATGNQTYLEWANKVWDWSVAVSFIDSSYYVYDGAGSKDNCSVSARNNVSFSYAAGIYMYGAAILANATENTDAATWVTRTEGLLDAAGSFFGPYDNSTNIMYEHACERNELCNTDMKSFKGYLSRFMAQSAVMVPSIQSTVSKYLQASATAIGKACSGGDASTTCGQKWYVGGFDGNTGLGQSMSALETVQGLLASAAPAPFSKDSIEDVRQSGGTGSTTGASSSTSAVISTTAMSSPAKTRRSRSLGVRVVPSTMVWGVAVTVVYWLGFVTV